ncbi:hypothetical protein ABFX02_02G134100 [Erythranthe guttata]
MGSVANQNPYTPYDSYRDCSLGICSIYCPQFCYLIFPPPPPSDDDSAAPFSPLIIAMIGVLAGAVLLVGYYTVVTRYCKRRRRRSSTDGGHTTTTRTTEPGSDENQNESGQNIQYQVAPAGMDESLIKAIAVCKYRNGDGLIEDTECAVCLSEFQENEPLRLLPKCSHAFHLPCIDTWLKSHSNCPLCRANVVALANSCVSQPPVDLVLVVDDQELSLSQQNVVIINDDNDDDDVDDDVVVSIQEFGNAGDSLGGAFSLPQRPILVSDILKFEEIDEYVQVESDELWRGVGSSNGVLYGGEESKFGSVNRNDDGVLLLRSPVATKRCVSNGRFMSNKGKKSMLPN